MSGAGPDPRRDPLAPWTVLGTRSVVKDRWIDLIAERCRTPAGAELSEYYVLNYPDWAHAVVVTRAGRFVRVRQWRQGAKAVSLEFAGGVVDAAETPEQAVAREVLEETGYGGDPPERLGLYWANPANQANRVHAFLIRNATRIADPHLDEAEALAVETCDAAEFLRSVRAGEMEQALHMATVGALLLHRPELLA